MTEYTLAVDDYISDDQSSDDSLSDDVIGNGQVRLTARRPVATESAIAFCRSSFTPPWSA
jgi:hypothetical protein